MADQETEKNFETGDNQSSSVPPPPGREVKIRTLESDVKSVEQSGGGIPEPEVIRLSELDSDLGKTPEPAPAPAPPAELTGEPPPFTRPISQTAPAVSEIAPPTPVKSKKWWLAAGSIVIIALVILGYWYLWFSNLPAEIPEEPAIEGGITLPATTAPPAINQSVFGFPPEKITEIKAGDSTVIGIITALQNRASFKTTEQLEEIVIKINDQSLPFNEYLNILLPETAGSNLEAVLKAVFEKNFTAFFYRDENNRAWPGYLVSLKPGVQIDQPSLLAQLADLEKASIVNLFLAPPQKQLPFKTAPFGKQFTRRYATFEQKPASLNYGLFGQYLIITTTDQALIEILKALEIL